MLRRLPRTDLLICLGLFLLPLAFFWQVTLGSRTLLPADNIYQYPPWSAYRAEMGVPDVPHNMLVSDLVLENYPWKQFIRQSIANREIPLWNPYLFSGVPFLAAGQHSALYPFSIVYYVMPLEKAYGWFTVSQLWLAGFLMYLFMRGLGVRRAGAIFAAIAYQLSTFFVASVVFQMVIAAAAWLPFLLLMVEFTIRQRPLLGQPTVILWVMFGGIGLGLCILAGHVEFVYYSLLVMGFWSACRLIGLLRQKTLNELARTAFALIALVVIGLGVGAVQFVPLFELASKNFREGSASFETVRDYAYKPRHALEFLIPNLYGSPAQHEYFDLFSGTQKTFGWQRGNDTVTDTYWEVGKNYVEGACYVGLLTLILAGIAFLPRSKVANSSQLSTDVPFRAYRFIFTLLAIISLSFMFGTVAYAILYYGLPGVNQLHSPFRWVWPFTLAMAALGGFGADTLSRLHEQRHRSSPLTEGEGLGVRAHKTINRLALVLIGAGVIVLLLLLASRLTLALNYSGWLRAIFDRVAGINTQFPNIETFYSVEFPQVLLFGLMLIASGVVLNLSQRPIYLPRQLGKRPLWELAALIVIALDLSIASAGFNSAADPAWLKFEPPAITWLKEHDPQNWRFITVDGGRKPLNANLGWLYGLQDVGGYDSIIPKQYVQYMEQVQPQGMLIYNRIATLTLKTIKGDFSYNIWDGGTGGSILRWPSIRYIVSDVEIPWRGYFGKELYPLAYQDKSIYIYENTEVLPRAYWFGPHDSANAGWKWVFPDTVHPVEIAANTLNQVTLKVNIPFDAYDGDQGEAPFSLILNDSYFPGWRAYVRPQNNLDSPEKEIAIELWEHNFLSIKLPPGNWTVRFRYTPQSVQVGAFGTFIAGAIILFALLVWLWRRFYIEGREATGVGRIAKNSAAPILLSLFNRAIDFAFAVVMLRVLSPTDVGTYYYAVVIIGWFDIITNFGLNTLLTRDVARNPAAAAYYLRRTSLLRIGLAVISVAPLIGFLLLRQRLPSVESTTAVNVWSTFASSIMHRSFAAAPPDSSVVLPILLLYLSLIPSGINNGLSALFYAFEKAEIPAVISTATAILSVVTRLAVLLLGFGILGLAGASIFLNMITLGLLLWQAIPLLRLTPNPSPQADMGDHIAPNSEKIEVKPTSYRVMIRESWPLMLNHLLATMFFKIDVTLLEPLKGKEVVAQYSVSYKWVDAIGVIPSFFTMALLPVMARQASDDKPGLMRNYQLAVKMLVMVALPVAVVTTFLAPILVSALGGSRYVEDGTRALQLMIWFIPVGWINSLTQYVLIALNMQRPLRWPFVAGVLFNLIANLIFIPLYSYQAASVVTILSEIVLQIGFYVLLRRSLGRVPWFDLLARPVMAAAIMFGVFALLWNASPLLALLLGGLSYPSALLILRPLSPIEVERLTPLLPGPLRRLAGV